MKITTGSTYGTLVATLLALTPATTLAALADDQVLSQHLHEADGTSGQNTGVGSGVKTSHIQDGAVTGRKLGIACPDGFYLQYTMFAGWTCGAGTPGPAGPAGATGPQGPVGASPRYANVVIVARSGGDFTDPVEAVEAITDASATNPYVIKIMPGIYPIVAPLRMKQYVDIEGSGEGVTTIRGNGDVADAVWSLYRCGGVVIGESHSELRQLTVEDAGAGSYISVGIMNDEVVRQKISNVTVIATGASTFLIAVFNRNSDLVMTNVTISASGYAYWGGMDTQTYRPVVLRNVTLLSGGMMNSNQYGGPLMIKCQGVYDGNYDPMTCPAP